MTKTRAKHIDHSARVGHDLINECPARMAELWLIDAQTQAVNYDVPKIQREQLVAERMRMHHEMKELAMKMGLTA